MAYTNAWNEALPSGAELANTIDNIFRADKVDLRERLGGIFGLNAAQFGADPIAPISLTLSGALTTGSLVLTTAVSRIVPGSTSLSLRNNANSADNLIITDAGIVSLRGAITTSAAAGDLVLANAKSLRGSNAGGTGTISLISLNTIDTVELGGGYSGPSSVIIRGAAPFGAAANVNGALLVDTTTLGQFIFYAGGNRYKLVGTAF